MRLGWLTIIAMFAVGCADSAPIPGVVPSAQTARAQHGPLGGAWSERGWGHHAPTDGGPCAGGTWGDIDPNGRVYHVRADGSDIDGTGSAQHPFATIGAAIDTAAAHDRGVHRIAVGPGVFPTQIALDDDDAKIDLMGCSPDETTLKAVSDTASILDAEGSHHFDVKGVELSGGWRAVRVRDGGHATLDDVTIRDSAQASVLVRGTTSEVTLTDSWVVDPQVVSDMGWGIAVLDGTLTMNGGGVDGATGLGIFGDAGTLSLTDVQVTGTASSPMGLGRGLHLQNGSNLTLTGGLFKKNADTSLFLLDSGNVVISGLVIDITSAGIVIDFPSTGLTGDGIVVYGGQNVQIYGSQVIDSARAALLFDGAQVTVSGNDTTDNGLSIGGYTKFAQDDAEAAGDDAPDVLDLHGALMLQDRSVDWADLLDDPED